MIESVETAAWEKLETESVFLKHKILEPGETVNDEVLIAAPSVGREFFKVELRLVSKRLIWKNIEWNTVSIIDPAPPEK